MKTSYRTSRTKTLSCLIAIVFLLTSVNSWAISVSPSPSYTGSYTLSWSQQTHPSFYSLYEKKNSGAWVQVSTPLAATSHSFSGKSVATYKYRIYGCPYGFCQVIEVLLLLWSKTPQHLLPPQAPVPITTVPTPSAGEPPPAQYATSYENVSMVVVGPCITLVLRRARPFPEKVMAPGSTGQKVVPKPTIHGAVAGAASRASLLPINRAFPHRYPSPRVPAPTAVIQSLGGHQAVA